MLTGGCLCGAVRYEALGPISDPSNCHCTLCRRASGAPFVAWFTVLRPSFRLLRGEPSTFRSSSKARRGFCGRCGTPLTFALDAVPHRVDVTIASLDEPNAVVPADHTYTSTQIAWVELADGLPRYREGRSD